MSIPGTLSYDDMFNTSRGRKGSKNPAPVYGNLPGATGFRGKVDKSGNVIYQGSQVPNIQLGLPDVNGKKKKKKSKSELRLEKTSIGKGIPKIGGKDNYNRFYEIENPNFDQVVNKGLLVEGMTNRSPQKLRPELGDRNPTLFQMLPIREQRTDSRGRTSTVTTQGFNFANPSFSQPRAVKRISGIEVKTVSPSAQNARSRGAAQSARSQISSLSKLSSYGVPVNLNIFTPGTTRSDGSRRPATQSQDQFSQNIKLLSAGLSLGDSKARAAVAQTQASLKAAAKHRNRETLKRTLAAHSSPSSGIAEANAILAEQGANYRFKSETRRIRRGNYEAYITKYYVGPNTRTSYTRTIHNGRQVTAYRGMAPGQLMGRGDPYSVINQHHKTAAVYDFAIANTEYKPTGLYYDPSLNSSAITNRITQLNAKAVARRKITRRVPIYKKISMQSRSSAYYQRRYGAAQLLNLSRGQGGRGYYVVVGSRQVTDYVTPGLSAAEKTELAKLNAQRPKAGGSGKAAFVAHVEREAAKKKKVLDTMITPLDSIYSYAAVSDEQIDDFQKYGGELKTNIIGFDTNIETLKQGIAKVNVARGITTKERSLATNYNKALSNFDAIEAKEKPFDATIASTTTNLADITGQLNTTQSSYLSEFGSGAVGKSTAGTIIATPGNRVIKGTGYYGKSAYRPRTGSTVISIPKDQIPANGKVVIEATVSYAGYKGPVKTVTSLGTVAGARGGRSQTIRKTLPVDANGNIVIKAAMTGNTRYHLTKTGLSNIKVIDPSKSSRGAQLVGDISSLTAQKSQLQSTLKENQGVKNYFDSAQLFLTGKSSSLKDTKGKAVASYSGGKLKIQNQDAYDKMFGSTDSKVFEATRAVYTPVSKLQSQTASLQSQKQAVLDREATRGVVLSVAKKKTLTTSAASLNAQATRIEKSAASIAASGHNNANNHHTKIEVRTSRRNQGRRELAQAATMRAQAAGLRTQAKQKLQFRDTGIDPTRPTPASVTSQVGAFDLQLGRLGAAESFLTGRTNKLVLDASALDGAIAAVNRVRASEVGALSARLAKQKADQGRNRNSYGFKKYAKNKGAVYASWEKSNKALSDQIAVKNATANKRIEQLKLAKTGKTDVTAATRGQAGLIDVQFKSIFTDLGISVPTALTKKDAPTFSTQFSVLEKQAAERDATQKILIAELKTVQMARIKENAKARVAQINRLVATRTVSRREAARMKNDLAKEVTASNKAITGVEDTVPIPDITEFDTDLRSEAQKILGETEGIIKGTKKAKAAARLRQVTRSRKPQGSPVGAVLKVGATVKRPRQQQQRNTSLPATITNLRNPFVK